MRDVRKNTGILSQTFLFCCHGRRSLARYRPVSLGRGMPMLIVVSEVRSI